MQIDAALIDEQGKLISPVKVNLKVFQNGNTVPHDIIKTSIPAHIKDPYWNGKQWIDGPPKKLWEKLGIKKKV